MIWYFIRFVNRYAKAEALHMIRKTSYSIKGESYMKRCVPLEPAAEAVCDQNSVPPLIFQMPPEQGRRVLEKAQGTPVYSIPPIYPQAA
jgi:hypothetical protein